MEQLVMLCQIPEESEKLPHMFRDPGTTAWDQAGLEQSQHQNAKQHCGEMRNVVASMNNIMPASVDHRFVFILSLVHH